MKQLQVLGFGAVGALPTDHPANRYHFNLRDGDILLQDPKGVALPDDTAALQHAKRLARGFKWVQWSIDVTDERGNTIGRIER